LWLVLPIAALLAVGAGGPEPSLLVLGPLVTYSFPLIVMIAFWWEDWPGTRLAPRRAGWVDTALVVVGGVALAALGQVLAGGFDPRGLFTPDPGPRHVPSFPATLPLGAAVFGVMLQLTLVGEGWPLHRLPALVAGPVALAVAWVLGLALYLALVRVEPPAGSRVLARKGPIAGADFGAAIVCIGAWQVLCCVVWHGRPLTAISSRALRLVCAHGLVLGAGLTTYFALRAVLDAAAVTALAGCFVAGGLVSGMLFELTKGGLTELGAALLASVALCAALSELARRLSFAHSSAEDWVAHATLNALAASTILHVAIGRRWPFAARERSP
jgi:hypothetical protein